MSWASVKINIGKSGFGVVFCFFFFFLLLPPSLGNSAAVFSVKQLEKINKWRSPRSSFHSPLGETMDQKNAES